MPIWFWGWLVTTALFAVVALVTRDTYTAPWVAGAAAATLLSGIGAAPVWHWIGFFGVSTVLFLALNRKRYAARHGKGTASAKRTKPRRSH